MPAAVAAATQTNRAQGKNLLGQKWGPLPVWGWLAIITVLFLGYYLIAGKKAKKGGGGQGLPKVPDIIIQNQEPSTTPPGPPPVTSPPSQGQPGVKGITVTKDQTFGEMAQEYHWSQNTIAAIEAMNQISGRGHLTPSTRLKKGEVILRPVNS